MRSRFPFLILSLATLLLSGCFKEDVPSGELFVMTQPQDAVVEVNGEVLGTTPLQAEVPSGKLLMRIRKDGFEEEWKTLNLITGQRIIEETTLTPVKGLVLIRSNPSGAAVSIGEVFAGNTPLAIHDIGLGAHRARLTMDGFDDKEIEFRVEDRIPKALDVDLISNSGILVVQSTPSGATVFVDGRNEGTTPMSLERIGRGEREITLQLPGFQEARRRVLVEPSATSRVEVAMTPLPGGLSVIAMPKGARVYVNGEFAGKAPVNITEIEPGAHLVRVEARGHADDSRRITIDRGERVVEEFRLERNSGTLQIVTRPANVRVSVNGEFMGTTQRGTDGSDVVSRPLQVDMLSQGSHTLQLVREGYSFETKRFFIRMDEVTALDETLERQFIPNVLIRIGNGPDDVITGVLIRRYNNGSVELEIRKGVFRTFTRSEYIDIEPLEQEETLEELEEDRTE